MVADTELILTRRNQQQHEHTLIFKEIFTQMKALKWIKNMETCTHINRAMNPVKSKQKLIVITFLSSIWKKKKYIFLNFGAKQNGKNVTIIQTWFKLTRFTNLILCVQVFIVSLIIPNYDL